MRGGREITVLDKDAQAQVNTEGLNQGVHHTVELWYR